MTDKPSILDTVDTFTACIPQGDHRAITVYRRQHGGREYVRLRVWHCHKDSGKWYPDPRRRFVVPLSDAEAVGKALIRTAQGRADEIPDWLADYEAEHAEAAQVRIDKLEALDAPPDKIEKARKSESRASRKKR